MPPSRTLRRSPLLTLVAPLASVLLTSLPARAEPIAVVSPSKLWIEGDSTLHKWKAEASGFTVASTGEQPSPGKLDAWARAEGLKSLLLTVPVVQLKSGEGGLDTNLHAALKADQFKDIVFKLDTYAVTDGANPGTLAIKLRGRLTIASVEKAIEVDTLAKADGPGLRLIGAKEVLISTYGLKPPSFMMGMMTVRDPVMVHFDLHLDPTP